MLVAQAKWLPQYKKHIPAAKQRLADHVKNGTRVLLKTGHGAARLETKSVAQMTADKADARKNAGAADKAHIGKKK